MKMPEARDRGNQDVGMPKEQLPPQADRASLQRKGKPDHEDDYSCW